MASSPSLSVISLQVLSRHAVWIGLILRLGLAWILPLLLDSGQLLPGVAYTDIDYHVFTDAAAYIQQRESPYQRTTYRYTPFLAQLLAHLELNLSSLQAGRYLFCIADALCGYLIAKYRQRQRRNQVKKHVNNENLSEDDQQSLIDALWWQYNPLAINICTRGSAESLMVLLPVLLTVWLVTWSTHACDQEHTMRALLWAVLGGVAHGIAVHSKLYPIIYSLSFVMALSSSSSESQGKNRPNTTEMAYITGRIQSFFTPAPLIFGIVSAGTFLGSTYLAVRWYGSQALEEGLLYHFSRVDHRHNYSMHWYWIYLVRAAVESTSNPEWAWLSIPWVGRILLVPQLVLLVYSSWTLAGNDLTLALFVQTFLFVAHNKVVTAQYFTWYLCLLPLCSHRFSLTPSVMRAIAGLLLSVVCWLGSAYLLEMQGLAVHRMVWVASVFFFVAEVNLLSALLRSVKSERKPKND